MSVSWTKEQQQVIDLRDRNILVSAAAGSGKTAVLVERIITMLTEGEAPVSVDELLIVTFTEAAAAEMKERIRAAIEKKIEEEPENEHLKRQATLIHHAQITTIHSFCLSVIRDHFHTINLDPGFRIGEEGELKLLRHDVMEDLLGERYEQGEPAYLDFILAYGGGRNDKKLEDLILRLYEFSRSYPDWEGWLDSCELAYEADTEEELEGSAYIEIVKENVHRYLADCEELLEQALSLCREPDGPAVYEEALCLDMQMVQEFRQLSTFAELNEAMRDIKWAKLTANRGKGVSEEKAAGVKAAREEVKTLVKDMVSQYFYQDVEGILEDLRLCRPCIRVLTGLVKEFAGRFEDGKRKKEMIDFSDMEQYALDILTEKDGGTFIPSAVAREYQKQYREIMIDEYQDSNLIQETILTSISTVSEGKYNIFMVGDVKQSIYRFRLSRPELFMEKFDAYSEEDSETQRIDLHKNFRSRREVLESANYIFRQTMTRELGGVAYDEKAALYTGASYKEAAKAGIDARTEVLVINSAPEAEDESAASETLTWQELEGRAIAGRIRELLRSHQIVDKETGDFRPVRYSDIVILTRSIRGLADVFTEVLNREGIPAYAGTKEGYFAAQEIGVVLDYLRVLDNWQQDIPLAAVLTSPFGNFSEEELAVIRSAYKEQPFYRAVFSYRKNGDGDARGNNVLQEKLERCLAQMEAFRRCVPYMPIHELLRKILADTGYGDFVSAMPGGSQRQANLEMLKERAKAFESTSYKGLFHFVRYMEQLQKYNVDYGEAALNDEQADTVRVMTIHKSKGLEFPVVFVAGMGKQLNMQDARSSVVLHARLGVGLDAVNLEKRTKSPVIIKKVIQKEEVLDSLGEELRVLYVALTRAKEKLIITGTISNLKKKLESYEVIRGRKKEALSFARLSKATAYWDWILPALVRLTPEVPIALQIINIEDIVQQEVEEEGASRLKKAALEQWDTEQVYEPKVREALKEQFGYVYAYESQRFQKVKFTVSELKKRAFLLEMAGSEAEPGEAFGEMMHEEPEIVPLIPKFLKEEEALSGASRGTAYHRLMELLDFTKDYTEEQLAETVQRLQESGRMSAEMAGCIQSGDIVEFLKSPLGSRIREAAGKGKLKTEQPFVLGVSQDGETILVQGIIDAYFEEEDGLVVLDYKTDKIYSAKELAQKYHAQLDYYGKALEQMTHRKVKEKIIYSFTQKKEIIV